MGLYAIDCPQCKKPFMWFSGTMDQRCSDCKGPRKVKFIVKFKGEYLVKTPYWNAGTWTKDKDKAEVNTHVEDLEFYARHYPQFEVIILEDSHGIIHTEVKNDTKSSDE